MECIVGVSKCELEGSVAVAAHVLRTSRGDPGRQGPAKRFEQIGACPGIERHWTEVFGCCPGAGQDRAGGFHSLSAHCAVYDPLAVHRHHQSLPYVLIIEEWFGGILRVEEHKPYLRQPGRVEVQGWVGKHLVQDA